MSEITLTNDQQAALEAFTAFLTNPLEPVFILSGYSGTGKSTLTKAILDQYPKILKLASIINNKINNLEVVLTATTNKAAESLYFATGEPTQTIHSFLGLRVSTNFKTNQTDLIPRKGFQLVENYLIFIDEASYIDSKLLDWIFRLTKNCKIVFLGDPAQLTPVKAVGTPVFNMKAPGAMLSQVVRQAENNPIIELSTKFRETVTSGEFFSFKPDGFHIQHMSRDDFNDEIIKEFSRPDWKFQDSKVLAWTNKTVVYYNHEIRDTVKGDPQFEIGDYAICNKFVQTYKTDQMVQITDMSNPVEEHGVLGIVYELNQGASRIFGPLSVAQRNARVKQARAEEDYGLIAEIENNWIDLRAAYACTINKAQGSTFDRVFIDLDDVSRCTSGDQIARMMYVAVSRARHQVFLTGDFK